jgi:ERF superfamily protein
MTTTDHTPATTRTTGETMNDRIAAITRNADLYKALLLAKADLPVVAKSRSARIQTQNGPGYTYSYADLADVDSQATPVLAEQGLLIDFEMHKADDGNQILTGMLIHPESGGFKTSEWDVTGRTPQDQGSSITYGRRYLIGILTGIITDEDTDGRQTQPGARPAPKRQARQNDDGATSMQIKRLQELARGGVRVSDVMQQVIGRVAAPGDLTEKEAVDVLQAIEQPAA